MGPNRPLRDVLGNFLLTPTAQHQAELSSNPEALAQWASECLKRQGVALNWGTDTYDRLERYGKKKRVSEFNHLRADEEGAQAGPSAAGRLEEPFTPPPIKVSNQTPNPNQFTSPIASERNPPIPVPSNRGTR
jgi:hypothetical protein